jgi:hypothetical protein
MQITNMSVDASTCSHLVVRGTIAGVEREIHIHRDELAIEPGELRDAFLARLRAFAKENGYSTVAQVRTNLPGKVFNL